MLLVLCHAGGNRYAIEARCVSEVVPRVALHRVAGAPPWLAGLLIHRGRTAPVVDLTHLVAGEEAPARLSSRIVIVQEELGGVPRRFGLLAERVDLCEVPSKPDAPARGSPTQADGGPPGRDTPWGRLVPDEQGAYEWIQIANLLPEPRQAVMFPG